MQTFFDKIKDNLIKWDKLNMRSHMYEFINIYIFHIIKLTNWQIKLIKNEKRKNDNKWYEWMKKKI